MNADDGVLVPLADRIRWTRLARALVIALPFAMWFTGETEHGPSTMPLVVGASVVAVTDVAARLAQGAGRRAALLTLGTTLLADGAYLVAAFLTLGGFAGPVGYAFVLHAITVTLLTSFRTGLKVVLWHSIALLVGIEAQMNGLLRGPLTGQPFPTHDYAQLIAVVWVTTLSTAALAAANERELRRRRYDAEVLRRLALGLEQATDVDTAARTLVGAACADLDARRAAVLVWAGRPEQEHTGVGCPAPLIRTAPHASDHASSRDADPGPLVRRACTEHRTILLETVTSEQAGWLCGAIPDARNVVVVPFVLDAPLMGVLVLEYGPARRLRGPVNGGGIERRRVATAEQATAHAAQAFGRAALMARLRASADTDGLTGLANRRAFDQALAREVARSAATNRPMALLLGDVDHFKAVNDTWGHKVGDDVLRAVADALAAAAGTQATAARYGGEEFALVCPATDLERATVIAEGVRAQVARTTHPPVTLSIGVAVTAGAASGPALVGAADAALYRAKRRGRDQVATGDPADVEATPLVSPRSGRHGATTP